MKLSDFSIRQPVFVTMLIVAIVVIGLVSYTRLGVDLLPDISLPIVAVTTVYPNTGPEEVETQVTKPIEEAVSSLAGVEKVRSTSAEGVSVVIVQFKLEIDPAKAATDVRDKISGIRGKLPRETNEPIIDKFDPSAAPIISFGVSALHERYPLDSLRTFAEDRIKPVLERLDGVASVEVLGGLEREIHVDVDFGKLLSRNVSIAQVTQALRQENVNLPAGRLSEGRHELLVRTQGEFGDVGQVGEVIVASPGGVPVYLKEIASITDGFKEKRVLSRVKGKECVLFTVRKQSGANTVSVAQAVQKAVEQLRSSFAEMDFRLSSDESEFIRDARNDVLLSLVLGSLLASLVVFVSFGDLRNTLVTVAGLPVCIVGAFAAMSLLGYTVNVITLLALSLSVGLLIDDAIVVRENIYRHMEELGKDPLRAAADGTSEVALAVTATTLTVVAVFLPVAFATGIAGRFFRQFGVTVTAAVLISLFEAFTFAPVLSAYFFKKGARSAGSAFGRVMTGLGQSYDRLNALYRPSLAWALGHRKTVIGLATLLFLGSLLLFGVVGTGGDPRGERPEFNIVLEYAPGINIGEADALTRRYEEILAGYREVSDLFTVVGSADGAADQAVIHVRVRPELVRAKAFQETVRPILEAIPGARMTFQEVSSFSGAAASALTQLPVQINVRGNDLGHLTAASDAIRDRLSRVAGLVDLSTDHRAARPEVQIHIDRDGANQLGMTTSQIASSFRTFIGGDVPTKFRQGEKEVDIRVRLTEVNRSRFERLKDLYLPTPRGDFISFSQVAEMRIENGPSQITRENRARQITVGGNITRGRVLGDVSKDVEATLAGMTFPSDVTVSIGGQSEQMSQSFASLGVSLVLAILFVYMVLASQFGSFLQPLTIMLALPLAVIGATVALLLAMKPFDIMAFIGLIMLMGLVTKNSILLIDYINRGRREGMARYDAILAAGAKRLRPILMTSFAMILGMLPVAFAFGTSASFRVSMGWTIIGGLISSTVLTLLVVPVVYTLLDDLAALIRPGKSSKGASRGRLSTIALIVVAALALGWGRTGHYFFNTRATLHLPPSMQRFIEDSTFFGEHASDADQRKGTDPSEGPKHFIDLENIRSYAELTSDLDSLVAVMGWTAVQENGILPWAAVRAYDSLVAQLGRGDWSDAQLTASDIGHYIGDAHQPLHCTVNYNGQLSGNGGIHSRYESGMIDANKAELVVQPGSVRYVPDRFRFMLAQCIESNGLVDSIMAADNAAKAVSGWNGSGTPPPSYYAALWGFTRSLTLREMQTGTEALASLWYSAWIDAGLVVPTSAPALDSFAPSMFALEQNFPNPFNSATRIRYVLPASTHAVLRVYDLAGKEVETLLDGPADPGEGSVRFDRPDLASGVYIYRLQAGPYVQCRKMIMLR